MITSIKQRTWHALRIATQGLTTHELSMVVDASNSAIKLHLYEWDKLGLLKVASAKPRKHKGRRPLVYSLIDKAVVYPPIIKYECK